MYWAGEGLKTSVEMDMMKSTSRQKNIELIKVSNSFCIQGCLSLNVASGVPSGGSIESLAFLFFKSSLSYGADWFRFNLEGQEFLLILQGVLVE